MDTIGGLYETFVNEVQVIPRLTQRSFKRSYSPEVTTTTEKIKVVCLQATVSLNHILRISKPQCFKKIVNLICNIIYFKLYLPVIYQVNGSLR